MTTTIRRTAALLLVLALAAAACSTGGGDDAGTVVEPEPTASEPETTEPDDDPETTEPETTEPPDVPLTASADGVTAEEINIGVAFWDTSVFGFGFFGDPDSVWSALTDGVDVNGRSISHTIAGFNPADTTGMLEACIKLTEDTTSFAVLGGMRGDATLCIQEQHATINVGSQVVAAGDSLERARAPIAGFTSDGNTAELIFIDELDGLGWFDGVTEVGLHFAGEDVHDRLIDDLEGALGDLGITVAIDINFGDLGLDEDQLENRTEILQQRVEDAGIGHMLIFGAAATGLVTYADLDIELASIDANNFTTAVSSGIDPANLDGTIAATGRLDLATDPVDEKTQACIDTVAAALPDERLERPGPGVENSADDPNYWPYTVLVCRDLDLFVQIATAAGPELTHESFQAGLDLLTQTSLPEIPFVSFGPDKLNGGDTLRLVQFDGDADEDGEVVSIAEPVGLTP
ncbi:MAG: hypothetical protein P8J50_14990 [Acidimicrobiales bacterium]|nr:hypothetical protein [Acidimicrobiales bacterium]